jgi:hypothetical protein
MKGEKMKIAQALQTQKALAAEISHLRNLEQQHGWSYRSFGGAREHPDADWQPNFDFDANHEKILEYSRLNTKLGQAISRTNLEIDVIGIDDGEFKDWA